MIDSVPAVSIHDDRFKQALILTEHLAVCRENWLDRMTGGGRSQKPFFAKSAAELGSLLPRFEALEQAWVTYLNSLNDDALSADFEFKSSDDESCCWNVEGQIRQLIGHAFYHRGQIVLLVDQLGGTTVDTDYLFWRYAQDTERWGCHKTVTP